MTPIRKNVVREPNLPTTAPGSRTSEMVFPAQDLVGQHLRSYVAFPPRQKHGHTDIYLPIDARQKQMFDSIDGERTIGEIARKHGDPDTARVLFERLWWYDQVVFDAPRRQRLPSEA
jgi:hypothetical protein